MTTSTSPSTSTMTDAERLKLAQEHIQEERLLVAAKLLQQIDDKSLLNDVHLKLLETAEVIEIAVKDLLSTPEESGNENDWKKQGCQGGKYDTTIYYKMEAGGSAKLTCRMETPVPSSLLIPLLSVLNESSLYHTWIPSWKRPFKIGVRQSNQLLNDTKGHQIIQVQCDVPWPMAAREVLMDVTAVDDIDARGFIIAKMRTLTEENKPIGFTIPPVESSMVRADYDGAVLFRACPTTHPNYQSARKKFPNQDLILLQFAIYFDAQMALVPTALINFITRTVIGHIWNMLLNVAEQVQKGTMPDHQAIITKKAHFYKWVKERCQVMLQEMEDQNNGNNSTKKENHDEDAKATTTTTTTTTKDGSATSAATEPKTCRQEEHEEWITDGVQRLST